MKNDGFSFIKYCNEKLTNMNDQTIAQALLRHLSHIDDISLEDIAQEAWISTASVSRFIKNAGFTSFKDFKKHMMRFQQGLLLRRSTDLRSRFASQGGEGYRNSLFSAALRNIRATADLVSPEQVRTFCENMLKARSIIILGDSHELADFYTLQLDLISLNIPTFLVNIHDGDHAFLNSLASRDTVLYIDVCVDWLDGERSLVLKRILEKKASLMVMAQEPNAFEVYTREIMPYGIPGSINDGYYSLPLICRILSDFLHQIQYEKDLDHVLA